MMLCSQILRRKIIENHLMLIITPKSNSNWKLTFYRILSRLNGNACVDVMVFDFRWISGHFTVNSNKYYWFRTCNGMLFLVHNNVIIQSIHSNCWVIYLVISEVYLCNMHISIKMRFLKSKFPFEVILFEIIGQCSIVYVNSYHSFLSTNFFYPTFHSLYDANLLFFSFVLYAATTFSIRLFLSLSLSLITYINTAQNNREWLTNK